MNNSSLTCNCLDHIEYNCPYHTELRRRNEKAKVEKADGNGWKMRCRKFVKHLKNKAERRRAKIDPECTPGYGRYRGWLT